MDTAAVLAAFDQQLRRDLPPSTATLDRAPRLTRHLGSGPDGWSGVVWSDLDTDTADEVVAGAVAWLRTVEGHGEWKHYEHDRPADLPERLRAAGLRPDEPESVMIAEAAAVPDFPAPAGTRVVDVEDDDGVELAVRVHELAFDADFAWLGKRMRAGLAAGGMDVVVVMAGDEPVSAARTDYYPGTEFAGLWGGGTVPAWRGRGAYRALVSQRARRAQARGIRYLQVDAAPTSRPILERVGFTRLTGTTPYTL
ncbi:GNAT family N-acetyltransferase [Actinokineospora sp. NBRC 105648]|uniref:GNAT family N-acetyltransferase n=1 Tax=Actinokineospora sp. NBRC 105648 TaxID=3032206 RepID=UPI0024A3194E|nr:GNAT family N-acetyltransferase [Actinokineospora sp. NBRC 105648]GLZ36780.1 hypothetical protein Acsp05_04050 [Actinokineospora sp. NBRC 105648]